MISFSMDSFASPKATRILTLLLAAGWVASINAAERVYYRAAVVDYHVLANYSSTPRQNFMANVLNYEQFIKKANQEKADIIVFPESALLGRDYSIHVTIPDPAQMIIPFNNLIYDESIRTLSFFAKNYSIYLAVNLHENYTDPNTEKTFEYNTNIVFNRDGAIVARYRKFNLYGEPLNVTNNPEHSYFDSDFGVRFGQFICFDILFKEPALTLINKYNVTDFIYPSQWFSELPFLTSVQRQWSWSVGNDVNLLSAGLNNVSRGNGGSGIFRGKNAQNNLYSFSTNAGTTILIGDIPIRGKATEGSGTPDTKEGFYTGEERFPMLQQNEINQFANDDISLPADRTSVDLKKELCHNNLCCSFDLSVHYVNPTSSVQYKIVAYDGIIHFGIDTHINMLQVCGVVLCLNHSITSCGSAGINGFLPIQNTFIPNVTFTSINITGNFINTDSNILPNVLLWPNNPALPSNPDDFLINAKEVNFDSNNKNSSLVLKPNRPIITVAIHSRVFSRDQGSSAYSMNVSMLAMLLPLLVPIVLTYLWSSKLKID